MARRIDVHAPHKPPHLRGQGMASGLALVGSMHRYRAQPIMCRQSQRIMSRPKPRCLNSNQYLVPMAKLVTLAGMYADVL